MRRVPGQMSLTGIIRTAGFCLVYVMLGDRKQQNFTLTVKEKSQGLTLVNKQKIKPETIKRRDIMKGHTYILQGVQEILHEEIQGETDLQEIQVKISKL